MIFCKDRLGKWHKYDDYMAMAQLFVPGFPANYVHLHDYLKRTCCIQEEKYIESPSVVDYLLMEMRVEAIKRYRDIHKCDLLEAKNMVDQIEKDMEDMKNGK